MKREEKHHTSKPMETKSTTLAILGPKDDRSLA